MISLIHSLYSSQRHEECGKVIDCLLKNPKSASRDAVLQAQLVKGGSVLWHSSTDDSVHDLGLIARHQGKISDSIGILSALKNSGSPSINVLKQLAKSITLTGNYEEAITLYDEALALCSDDWVLHFEKGQCYKHLDEPHNAEKCFLDALALQRHEAIVLELGKLYILQNNFDSALYVYEGAIKSLPSNAEIILALGLLYLRAGDSEKALNLAQLVVDKDPKNLGALKTVITVLQQPYSNQQVDTLLLHKNYKLSLGESPENSTLWSNLGATLLNNSRKPLAALSSLQTALLQSPLESWETPYNLGLVYIECGMFVGAFCSLNLAAVLNPGCVQILERLQFCVASLKSIK
ncbi:hypothetical protein BDR26DRAFT_1006721 [Obelidium mucronatum]|nr:hypothetical protein BDR26DRAFT_1006721 [Obelidium mucronatum]